MFALGVGIRAVGVVGAVLHFVFFKWVAKISKIMVLRNNIFLVVDLTQVWTATIEQVVECLICLIEQYSGTI